jgi:PleD family two-component response regulator
LFRRADAALYHAKRAGRNRVSTEIEIIDEIAKAS